MWDGERDVDGDQALCVIAWHRNPSGEWLSRHMAAVELINVWRPTEAVDGSLPVSRSTHEHSDFCKNLTAQKSDER